MSDAPAGGSAGEDNGAGDLARGADAEGDGGSGGEPDNGGLARGADAEGDGGSGGGNSGDGLVTRLEMGNPIPVPPAKRKRGPGLASPHFLVFGPPVPGALHAKTVLTVPRTAGPLVNGQARVGPTVPGGNLNPRRSTGGVFVPPIDRGNDTSGLGGGSGFGDNDHERRDNDLNAHTRFINNLAAKGSRTHTMSTAELRACDQFSAQYSPGSHVLVAFARNCSSYGGHFCC